MKRKLVITVVLIASFLVGLFVAKRLKPHVEEAYYVNLPADASEEAYHTSYVTPHVSDVQGDEENVTEIQCPIPMKNRVKNHTGIQCVFSSIEMLGRWAEEPKLTNPPITSRSNCKSYSGPNDAGNKLRKLGVKFEQTYGDRQEGLELIKKAMSEGRGCLFGVPGHAMVLVHYCTKSDTVKWVNNSDRTLRVQTTTIAGFHKMWRSWVLVIYADNDVIPMKLGRWPRMIPIKDMNENPNLNPPKDLIPLPRRRAA